MRTGDNRRGKMRRPIVRAAAQQTLDYNGLKAGWCAAIARHAQRQGLPGRAKSWLFPLVIGFHFYEPDKHRDCDNVDGGAKKLVLDGLVDAGVLPTDGVEHVIGFHRPEFRYGMGAGVTVAFWTIAEDRPFDYLLLPDLRLPELNELFAAREQAGRRAERKAAIYRG